MQDRMVVGGVGSRNDFGERMHYGLAVAERPIGGPEHEVYQRAGQFDL